ncbi:MAG: pyridoxamine 5'-phosphate oxidase family protein [Defluviitaleaceae bacterium]|nr:pyridoxamine 5'-phosphate oxidase family protein [Defluviitaleaceae bacterium]
MEHDGELYISTANTKDVYHQLITNPRVQIVSHKPGTREWIRIDGKAIEVHDLDIKQKMLDTCPVLTKRFDSNKCEYFALFKIAGMVSALNINGKFITLT